MARYIDADKVADYIASLDKNGNGTISNITINVDDFIADVTEVKHGHWINDGYACGDTQWTCSVCGEYEFRAGKRPYCCNCGAKMDEGVE